MGDGYGRMRYAAAGNPSSADRFESMLSDIPGIDIDASSRKVSIRVKTSGGVWTKVWVPQFDTIVARLTLAGYRFKSDGGRGLRAVRLLVEYA